MQRTDLTELEIEVQDLKLRLARPNANSQTALTQIPVTHLPPTHAAAEKLNPNENLQAKDNQNAFKSPMVGTFYRRPGPEELSYVEVGYMIVDRDPVLASFGSCEGFPDFNFSLLLQKFAMKILFSFHSRKNT